MQRENGVLKYHKFDRQQNWSTIKIQKESLLEVNDDLPGKYNPGGKIKFKTILLWPRLCNYSDVYIFVKGNIITSGVWADVVARNAKESQSKIVQHPEDASVKYIISEQMMHRIRYCNVFG